VRSEEQTTIAQFWSDFSYTATPPGHWQEIAGAIARTQKRSLAEQARLFALLSLAQADTAIVTWEAKYRYHFWRPVTANLAADVDDNLQTIMEPGWEPLLVTPPFPEYPSGHSAFSGASAAVLIRSLGTDQIAFSITADGLPGVTRSFTRLWDCAEEVGMSRIYGGIHFMSANVDGKTTGWRIGTYVADHFLLAHDRLPILLVDGFGKGALHLRLHGRIGRVARLERSADLARWELVTTVPFVTGGVRVECEASAELPARFYRLAEE
jgi:membrane-associated phospholipid phosphatase